MSNSIILLLIGIVSFIVPFAFFGYVRHNVKKVETSIDSDKH